VNAKKRLAILLHCDDDADWREQEDWEVEAAGIHEDEPQEEEERDER
jgi:hypothetical protein